MYMCGVCMAWCECVCVYVFVRVSVCLCVCVWCGVACVDTLGRVAEKGIYEEVTLSGTGMS